MTAFPTAFETMKPKAVGSTGLTAAAYNTKFRRPDRTPERTVVEKSADARILCWLESMALHSRPKCDAAGTEPHSQIDKPAI
jgi:hypothetical protein